MAAQKVSFVLAGLFVAALIFGAILLAGTLSPKFEPFGPEHHRNCGEPVTMRAEGYNILGGTRYARGDGDIGSDIPLANLDLCSPFVEVKASGEQRLWFWVEIETIGQVFPYAAWGLPWEDVARGNPADGRNPVDPIWSPDSIYGVAYGPDAFNSAWTGRRAAVCDDWGQSGLQQFYNGSSAFTIPYGTTQAGWVCLTFSAPEHPIRLPSALLVTGKPQRARLTRWADAVIWMQQSREQEEQGGQAVGVFVDDPLNVCAYAELRQPGSTLSGGPCDVEGS